MAAVPPDVPDMRGDFGHSLPGRSILGMLVGVAQLQPVAGAEIPHQLHFDARGIDAIVVVDETRQLTGWNGRSIWMRSRRKLP